MMLRFVSFLFLATASVFAPEGCSSYSIPRPAQPKSSPTGTALSVGVTYDDSAYLMSRAEMCADSAMCSLEEAQLCLDNILQVQMECVGAGILSTSPVCDNVDTTAETVAKLRQKIEVQRRRLAPVKAGVNLLNVLVGFYVVSSVLHGVAAVPNVPVDSFSLLDDDRSVTPFLLQEWIWAARDGYLPLMMQQSLNHGGLVVDASSFDGKVVALTLQEWFWAVRNGGLATILEHNMKYGGLLVDSSYDDGAIPLTMQEVWWSAAGGYGNVALGHFFRNGGL